MDVYKEQCLNMNMLVWLDEHGNQVYKEMKRKNKTIDYFKISNKDALYVAQFFDVTTWWKEHEAKFPELAISASIILGKPTHNAFQERVFSRGTYTDTKLKRI